MVTIPRDVQKTLLLRIARRELLEHGFVPDFPPEALSQAESVTEADGPYDGDVRDLRDLAWCSIDNDDSLDLDQLSVAEALPDGRVRVLVAVADVSAVVPPGSPIDAYASANTTSVYLPPRVFPMLPERLSTDVTSLREGRDRLAVVVEMIVDGEGEVDAGSVYRAVVRNHAKLAYPSVADWLEGEGEMPEAIGGVPGLEAGLRLQDRTAALLKEYRHKRGALELDTIEVKARFDGDAVVGLDADERNRAKEIIEDFMIAANGVVARTLAERGFPVVRRVVRSPERWPRIVDMARAVGARLPAEPDPKALHAFLVERRDADPVRFPDLSLAIVKLLGRGEYVASFPGEGKDGHFGLAASDYTHSTAPNRRYPDLITQRLLKAALAGRGVPYARSELEDLAAHCTKKGNDVQKVERMLRKAAAACLLEGQIGRKFKGIVTGAAAKGTWVRIEHPPVEGRVVRGANGMDVGDFVMVKLVHTDPERGHIDFVRAKAPYRERRRR